MLSQIAKNNLFNSITKIIKPAKDNIQNIRLLLDDVDFDCNKLDMNINNDNKALA